MSQQCTTCFHARESIISAQAATRQQALKRFIELQGEGYAPAMCEGRDGAYTVCYNLAQRPLASLRPLAIGQPADGRRP